MSFEIEGIQYDLTANSGRYSHISWTNINGVYINVMFDNGKPRRVGLIKKRTPENSYDITFWEEDGFPEEVLGLIRTAQQVEPLIKQYMVQQAAEDVRYIKSLL